MDIPVIEADEGTEVLGAETRYVQGLKKAVLLTAGAAVQKLAQSLAKEQEVILYLADMLIEVYAAESVLLRVRQLHANAEVKDAEAKDTEAQVAMAQVYIHDAAFKVQQAGRQAINAFASGDEQRMLQMG